MARRSLFRSRSLALSTLLSLVAPAAAQAPIPPTPVPHWEPLASLPGAGPEVYRIESTPADPLRLYAASSAGILVSNDLGQSWSVLPPHRPTYASVGPIAVSSDDADVLLLGASADGLWRTADGGASWSRPLAGPVDTVLTNIAFAPSDGSVAFLAEVNGVWRSVDGGGTFELVLSGLAGNPFRIAIDHADAQHVYVSALGDALYETLDGGATWCPKAFPAGVNFPLTLAVDPADGERIALGSGGVVHWSGDGGDSWTGATDGLGGATIDSIEIDPNDPQRVYAGLRFAGLGVSDDGGLTWMASADPGLDRSGGLPQTVHASEVDPNLVVLGDRGGVFRSTDRGQTFARSNEGLSGAAMVSDLAVDPLDATHLVAKTGGSAFVSHDEGASWSEATGLVRSWGYAAAADPTTPDRFWLGVWGGGLWRSDDGGHHYQLASSSPSIAHLAVHPTIPGSLLVSGSQGVWQSADGGTTFTKASVPLGWAWSAAISPANPDVQYCSGSSALYRTEDGGATWHPADASPTGIVRSIVPDPFDSERAWASSPGTGVFRSDDRGRTWTLMDPQLERSPEVVVPLFAPELLITGGVRLRTYASRDGGATAFLFGRGLTGNTRAFASSPTSLFAATSAGVFVLR